MQSFQHATQDAEQRAALSASQPSAKQKSTHAKNRGRIDVMADVLNSSRSPASKSHIMLFANVNSIVATRMISSLTETGLLDSVHENANVFYLATPKGIGFVAKYLDLQHMISPQLVPEESKTNNPNRLNSLNF